MVSDLNFTIGLTESKYKRSYDVAKAAVQQDEDKVLEIIEKTLDDNKAEDVVVIDLRGKTSIANQMVVASGTSQRHVASLAEKVQENLKAAGFSSTV